MPTPSIPPGAREPRWARPPLIPLTLVEEAARRIAPHLRATPLRESDAVSAACGRRTLLKPEIFQKTGSFKSRGALNALLAGAASGRRGVVTVSAGNHAQAVAWAASIAGLPATVVMPRTAPAVKVSACRGYGARVELSPAVGEAFERAEELARLEDLFFLHPFDHPDVVAGQGTVGLELARDLPEEVEVVIIPVGGGGLLAGVAAVLSALRPRIRLFGVEPLGAAALSRSLAAGYPLTLEGVESVADGLAAPMAGSIALAHASTQVEGIVTVDDEDILAGVALLFTRAKLVVEPAGAAGVGALLAGRLPGGGTVATVLCGGNLDPTLCSRLPIL